MISLFMGISLFLGAIVALVWSRYVESSPQAPLPSCTPRGECEGCDTCITRDVCLESGLYVETLCDCSCNPESFLSGDYAAMCSGNSDIFPMCDCSACNASFDTICDWVREDLGCDCSKCDYVAVDDFHPNSQKCDPELCCYYPETVLASCSGDQQSGGPCDCAVCAQAGSVNVCPDGTIGIDCYGCSTSNFSGDNEANCLVRGCPNKLVTLDEACTHLKTAQLNTDEGTYVCYAGQGDTTTPTYQNYGWCPRVKAGSTEYGVLPYWRYGLCQDKKALTCTDCSGLDDASACTSYEGCAWKDGSGEGVGVCESTICASGVACFRSNDPNVNTLMNNNSSAIPSCCLPVPTPTSIP